MESIATSANTFFNNNAANTFYFDYSNESHTAVDSQFDNSYEYVSTEKIMELLLPCQACS